MENSIKREYPDRPIIGVGGIVFKEHSILLVRRAQSPGLGQWSLPGGAVELGETLIQALGREILEEVSIEIEVGGLVRLLDKILMDRGKRVRFHYVIADYWGWFVKGRLKAASDISDAKFVDIDKVQEMDIIDDEIKETVAMAVKIRSQPAFAL